MYVCACMRACVRVLGLSGLVSYATVFQLNSAEPVNVV